MTDPNTVFKELLTDCASRNLPHNPAASLNDAVCHAAASLDESDLQAMGIYPEAYAEAYAFFVAEVKRLHHLRQLKGNAA